MNSVGHGS
jgi:hypothetical protein